MFEIFDLSTAASGLVGLCEDPGVDVWAAGAGVGVLPPVFSELEGCLFLQEGRLRLDDATLLEGPTLALLPPGDTQRLESLGSFVQMFLWVLYATPGEAPSPKRRVLLASPDLASPRTITGSTSILHWLPRGTGAERRTLAGDPSLALNLGGAPIPMVAGGELVPLAGAHGAIARDVLTLRVVPRSGPVIAVERIVPS